MLDNLYSFEPVDTLFFRGAEAMIMGESHSVSYIFPPSIHTIAGAIRTFLFRKDKNKYKDIIKVGEEFGGFNIVGPFFFYKNELYVPAPYSWFYEKSDEENSKVKIFKLKKIENNIVKTKSNSLYWVKGENDEVITLGGRWIKLQDLYSNAKEIEIKPKTLFYEEEQRIGIALKGDNRIAREGHIYSFAHIRLKEGVKIVFSLDIELPEKEGILHLGAEKRFGKFKLINEIKKNIQLKENGNFFMALSIINGNEEINKHLIATGKINYIGGWDLHKGFHKPMKGYFPAGTVFLKKFNNCIPID